jgi:hypothetical protein
VQKREPRSGTSLFGGNTILSVHAVKVAVLHFNSQSLGALQNVETRHILLVQVLVESRSSDTELLRERLG